MVVRDESRKIGTKIRVISTPTLSTSPGHKPETNSTSRPLYHCNVTYFPKTMPELVIAHYTENLNWVRNLPAGLLTTIYDKSLEGLLEWNAVSLPNVGREAHTYLHHIVNRYDSLAEWTIFCQGKPFDHAYDFKKTLREMVLDPWNWLDCTGFKPGAIQPIPGV